MTALKYCPGLTAGTSKKERKDFIKMGIYDIEEIKCKKIPVNLICFGINDKSY